MHRVSTARLTSAPQDVAKAARLLAEGELVAFPTETVYGLGADARNGRAVAAVYEAKGRPQFNPLIVHVADANAAQTLVQWNGNADKLANTFWPGPLTFVLPLLPGHGLASLVTAGLPTAAVRVPCHPVAQALLAEFDGPIAAPSANLSGRVSPTTAEHVLAGLSGRVAAVLDGGACPVGLESTIVDLTDATPRLLRPGGVPAEDLARILGAAPTPADASSPVSAPGQLASHYAPRASVRLDAALPLPGEVMLGFGPMEADLNLSVSGDLGEAAANLFDYLHRLDAMGRPIAVAPIPDVGLGAAINDRLRRAAAPR